MIVILLLVILSVIIALKVGSKRKIGFDWTLFFCLLFSPLIGYYVTQTSPHKTANSSVKKPNWVTWIFTGIFFLASIFIFYKVIEKTKEKSEAEEYMQKEYNSGIILGIALGIGFL